MKSLFGAVGVLAVVAFLVFAGVAVDELSYASSHPYRYGPAKVIASAAAGGAVLAVALALLAVGLSRALPPDGRR